MGKTPRTQSSSALDRDATAHAGASPDVSSDSTDACAAPGSQERVRRLQALVRLAELGQYKPDLDALAEALLDRAPELFVRERVEERSKSGHKNKKAALRGAFEQ